MPRRPGSKPTATAEVNLDSEESSSGEDESSSDDEESSEEEESFGFDEPLGPAPAAAAPAPVAHIAQVVPIPAPKPAPTPISPTKGGYGMPPSAVPAATQSKGSESAPLLGGFGGVGGASSGGGGGRGGGGRDRRVQVRSAPCAFATPTPSMIRVDPRRVMCL